MPSARRQRLLRLLQHQGVLAAREATARGFHAQELTRLVATGVAERISRGQYRLAGRPVTEHHGLAVVSHASPRGVICLLSALGVHGIGTQLPAEVWLAIDRRARMPAIEYPPVRVVRFSGPAFTDGIETLRIEGHPVRVYGVAKTLADLFKYRNRVGLDVAMEALREAWQARRFTMTEIDRFARICRVERVMRPYLEALVG